MVAYNASLQTWLTPTTTELNNNNTRYYWTHQSGAEGIYAPNTYGAEWGQSAGSWQNMSQRNGAIWFIPPFIRDDSGDRTGSNVITNPSTGWIPSNGWGYIQSLSFRSYRGDNNGGNTPSLFVEFYDASANKIDLVPNANRLIYDRVRIGLPMSPSPGRFDRDANEQNLEDINNAISEILAEKHGDPNTIRMALYIGTAHNGKVYIKGDISLTIEMANTNTEKFIPLSPETPAGTLINRIENAKTSLANIMGNRGFNADWLHIRGVAKSINDGGRDIYDGGNMIVTDLRGLDVNNTGLFQTTDELVAGFARDRALLYNYDTLQEDSDHFGPGSKHKIFYEGPVWMMVVEDSKARKVRIFGGLGSDNFTVKDTHTFTHNGYKVLIKHSHDGESGTWGDPSISHIFIVKNTGNHHRHLIQSGGIGDDDNSEIRFFNPRGEDFIYAAVAGTTGGSDVQSNPPPDPQYSDLGGTQIVTASDTILRDLAKGIIAVINPGSSSSEGGSSSSSGGGGGGGGGSSATNIYFKQHSDAFSWPFFKFYTDAGYTTELSTLAAGTTYKFNYKADDAGHPFWIGGATSSHASDLPSGATIQNEATGRNKSGGIQPGESLELVLTTDFSGSLVYYCTTHSTMVAEFFETREVVAQIFTIFDVLDNYQKGGVADPSSINIVQLGNDLANLKINGVFQSEENFVPNDFSNFSVTVDEIECDASSVLIIDPSGMLSLNANHYKFTHPDNYGGTQSVVIGFTVRDSLSSATDDGTISFTLKTLPVPVAKDNVDLGFGNLSTNSIITRDVFGSNATNLVESTVTVGDSEYDYPHAFTASNFNIDSVRIADASDVTLRYLEYNTDWGSIANGNLLVRAPSNPSARSSDWNYVYVLSVDSSGNMEINTNSPIFNGSDRIGLIDVTVNFTVTDSTHNTNDTGSLVFKVDNSYISPGLDQNIPMNGRRYVNSAVPGIYEFHGAGDVVVEGGMSVGTGIAMTGRSTADVALISGGGLSVRETASASVTAVISGTVDLADSATLAAGTVSGVDASVGVAGYASADINTFSGGIISVTGSGEVAINNFTGGAVTLDNDAVAVINGATAGTISASGNSTVSIFGTSGGDGDVTLNAGDTFDGSISINNINATINASGSVDGLSFVGTTADVNMLGGQSLTIDSASDSEITVDSTLSSSVPTVIVADGTDNVTFQATAGFFTFTGSGVNTDIRLQDEDGNPISATTLTRSLDDEVFCTEHLNNPRLMGPPPLSRGAYWGGTAILAVSGEVVNYNSWDARANLNLTVDDETRTTTVSKDGDEIISLTENLGGIQRLGDVEQGTNVAYTRMVIEKGDAALPSGSMSISQLQDMANDSYKWKF